MEFDDRVKQIAEAEKDVNKVLKAAQLDRHPISNERLSMILAYITTIIAIIAITVVLVVFIYCVYKARTY